MRHQSKPILLLMADDDPDDQLLLQEAVKEAHITCDLRFVDDGDELLDYLYTRGAYADADAAPAPDLILLDLNMPMKSGHEALEEIKLDPHLLRIPVVVFTTSRAEQDVVRSYELGVNSYITKSLSFDELVDLVDRVYNYWFQTATLPGRAGDS